MAALDQISALTNSVFIPLLVDNVLQSNPFLVYLARKSVKLDGGADIRQPVTLTKNSTATSYSGADVLPLAFDEENSAAQFNWAQYAATVSLTGLDDLRNDGSRAVINLVGAKIRIAEASLRQQMGSDMQGDGTGNSNKNIIGLAAAVDDGTNVGTYGNISRTTYTNWKSVYSANGGTGRALTLSLMNTQYENCSKDNDRPNLIITTHLTYQKYMGLLQPFQRFSDSNLGQMGFKNLTYQGQPVVVDEQVQTSPVHKMWILNTRYFDLYVSQKRNFLFVPFQQIANQDVAVSKILFAGQLVCSSPRLQCQITDIDPTL